jgi:cytochrome c
MVFRGIEDDEDRAGLIAFLGKATVEGGAAKMVEAGLIPGGIAEGQVPSSLRDATADQVVAELRHCGDAFHVTTKTGASFPFWETNVRLKVDTSERGPWPGEVVLMRSGMEGDRVSVIFASLDELRERLVERC